jgi:carotenoid cleavage dioxygenase-like enzyme
MSVMTESIPSANSTGAPYVAGNFAPLRSEVTSFDLEVIGHVPEELTGRFLRIGPNPIDQLDQVRLVRHHWLAGSGMAHGLRLRGGKANGSAAASSLIETPPAPRFMITVGAG